MPRGRKPKPTNLKILVGTRADRINADEPDAAKGLPSPPDCLDDLARDEWGRMVSILGEMGLASRSDGSALAIYCQAFSRWSQAEAGIRQYGLLVQSGEDGVKPNPMVAISRDAAAAMHKMLIEFGLTPSSRSRIRTQGDTPKDALEEFLKRG